MKPRFIYEIADHTALKVYIGLTTDPKRRLRQHRLTSRRLIEVFGRSMVMTVLLGPVDESTAVDREGFYVAHYTLMGYDVLNRAPVGGLGGRSELWFKELCRLTALKYTTRSGFKNGDEQAYNKAARSGWLDDLCTHMDYLQLPNGYWTLERCREAASHYQTRTEFNRECKSAYSAAYENGWLDDVCGHMSLQHFKNGHWTNENIALKAKEFPTRSAFVKGCSSAYSIAAKRGILDDVCAHMTKPVRSSTKRL